eukprot:55086-Amphidinium_carterae.1
MHATSSVRRTATICMGSGGSIRAKPPHTQRVDILSFEDLLCFALWPDLELLDMSVMASSIQPPDTQT